MGSSQSKRKLVPNRPPPKVPHPSKPLQSAPKTPPLVPPDGGWGWIVLFGAILTMVVYPAVTIAFGVLFSEHLQALGAGPTTFTLIGNLQSAVWSFVAVFIAPVSELFGYRSVTIVGGLLSFLTMTLCAYSTSITSFTLGYAVIGGLSGSFSTFNSVSIIPHYFTKRKGFATGVMSFFSSLGKIAMAPAIRFLLELYGYTWACLLLAAMSLHTCFAGMLFHPPEWHMVPAKPGDDESPGTPVAITEGGIVDDSPSHLPPTPTPLPPKIEEEEENVLFVMPVVNTPLPSRRDDEVVLFSRPSTSNLRERRTSERGLGVPRVESTLSMAGSMPFLAPIDNKVYTDDDDEGPKACCDDFVVVKVFRMLNYSLLKEPYFHLVAWPNAMALTAYLNTLYALPDYVVALHYSHYQGAFAISVFSFCEAFMRLAVAVMSDLAWFPHEAAYTGAFFLASLATILMTLVPAYEWILVWQAVNSLAMAAVSVLLIHVVLRHFPIEDYAQILGFLSILNGVVLLAGGYVIGHVTEHVSIHAQFLVMAGIMFVAGLVWLAKLCYNLKKRYTKVLPPEH